MFRENTYIPKLLYMKDIHIGNFFSGRLSQFLIIHVYYAKIMLAINV